jgi:hypothetical protein
MLDTGSGVCHIMLLAQKGKFFVVDVPLSEVHPDRQLAGISLHDSVSEDQPLTGIG